MKVLVPIKRVVDPYVNIRVRSDGSGVETVSVKMSMNPFCEIAVEQAVRMKEAGQVSEIIIVSIGPSQAQETLRTALAIGADRALLISTDTLPEPRVIAKCLQLIAVREQPQLVMLGKQSIDGEHNQTGQMLAGLLGWAQGTFASRVELNNGRVYVTREVDGGLETVALRLPAVITTDLRLNEPRYATLPNIMQARKKPLVITPLDELGVDTTSRVKMLKVEEPPKRQAGVMVRSVSELVGKLRNEAKVI